MTEPIRMIVAGAGRGRSHLRSFIELPAQFEVAGLVDLDPGRVAEALEHFSLPAGMGYRSFDEALAESDCDGVMIATWARTHEELIEKALLAGKHVLVEKPFAVELESARRLLDTAESRGLKIAVTQQWRYLPGQRTVRRLLGANAFGTPQTGHMVSYKARGAEYPDSPYSQLWQMTVHEVDSLIAMMNQPVVEVHGHAYRPPETTWRREAAVTAELTFENGCRMAMVSTSDARTHWCEFRVECARAALVYRGQGGFGPEEELFQGEDRQTGLRPLAIDENLDRSPLDRQVASSFAAWLRGGPEPETSGRNNLQVLSVLDGIIRSGAANRPVELRPT